MLEISKKERDFMELSIFLPMTILVLERDRAIIERSSFKIKKPYIILIDSSIEAIQKDLFKIKRFMKRNNLKVQFLERDESFTNYLFIYNRYEEKYNYFNPRIRNKVQQLIEHYFSAYSSLN